MYEEYSNKLKELYADVPESQRQIAFDAIDDYVFYLDQNEKLKKLPQIMVSNNNPAKQQRTTANKMLKENSQTISNIRKLLLMVLYRAGGEDEDNNQLAKLLAQFE